MIILGLIFLLIGYVVGIGILAKLGWILIIIGLVLLVLGGVGRPIGGPSGRRWYW